MSMSKREKTLAGIVGGIVVLIAGQWTWSNIQSGFQAKEDQIASLKKKIDDQSLEVAKGELSKKRIDKVTPRSISKRDEIAISDYERWLIEVAEQANLADPATTLQSASPPGKDGFQFVKFQLRGTGTIEDVTNLLYEYYSKPFLHRITSLSVAPAGAQTKDLDRLSVTLQSEVMSIPSAQEVQPTLQPDYTLLAKPLDDYRKSIVGRNLFSPPNNPPKLATTRNVDAVQGLRIDYAPDAKDPDAHHYISYQIEGEVPEGITIDPRTGKLNGTIRELGDYKFSIIATDSGFPAKSVTQLVTIRVKEPPVPPPPERKFDVASQSKLTGLVTGKNGAEGWVFSRTDGKTLKLKEGDEMKLGDVSGKVKKVGATYMVVETDGKEWTIGIDEIVSDAFKRGQVD